MAHDRLRRRAQRPAAYAILAAVSVALFIVGVAGLIRLTS